MHVQVSNPFSIQPLIIEKPATHAHAMQPALQHHHLLRDGWTDGRRVLARPRASRQILTF